MKQVQRAVFAVSIAAIVSGCSVNVSVPTETRPQQPDVERPTAPQLPPAPERDSTPVEISREERTDSSAAELELLDISQQEVDRGNYHRAISFAERVLSMNVRNPSAYEVLAQAYSGLGQDGRAAQIARKGLRYVESGSYQEQRLTQYLR